ncbi:hypothetical protein [Trichoplusia ni ascovirus 2c]|uniref:hypothetical protein n=1 Tax=Trichoplusia ni ascovirus 2c TaxID=328615 RepID=UPI0000E441E3|nr:hypothetical protein TNAV2c_gp011 [Trichoplusia ni ascovirus 2c]ABF70528.1 hypothetical protein [Trichoplusia ni ascovirus 2c]
MMMSFIVTNKHSGPLAFVLDEWLSDTVFSGKTYRSISSAIDEYLDFYETDTYARSMTVVTDNVIKHVLARDEDFRDTLKSTGASHLTYTDFDGIWPEDKDIYANCLMELRKNMNIYGDTLEKCFELKSLLTVMIYHRDIFKDLFYAITGIYDEENIEQQDDEDTTVKTIWAYSHHRRHLKYARFELDKVLKVVKSLALQSNAPPTQIRRYILEPPSICSISNQIIYTNANDLLYDVLLDSCNINKNDILGRNIITTMDIRRNEAILKFIYENDVEESYKITTTGVYLRDVHSYISQKPADYAVNLNRWLDRITKIHDGIPDVLVRDAMYAWPRKNYELRHLMECMSKIPNPRQVIHDVDDSSIMYPLKQLEDFRIDQVKYASMAHAIVIMSVAFHFGIHPKELVKKFALPADVIQALGLLKSRMYEVSFLIGGEMVSQIRGQKIKNNLWFLAEALHVMDKYNVQVRNETLYSSISINDILPFLKHHNKWNDDKTYIDEKSLMGKSPLTRYMITYLITELLELTNFLLGNGEITSLKFVYKTFLDGAYYHDDDDSTALYRIESNIDKAFVDDMFKILSKQFQITQTEREYLFHTCIQSLSNGGGGGGSDGSRNYLVLQAYKYMVNMTRTFSMNRDLVSNALRSIALRVAYIYQGFKRDDIVQIAYYILIGEFKTIPTEMETLRLTLIDIDSSLNIPKFRQWCQMNEYHLDNCHKLDDILDNMMDKPENLPFVKIKIWNDLHYNRK